MKLLGVIGDPIEHSLSPELFDYLFKALQVEGRYDPYRVTPEGLEDFVRTSRLGGLLGFNVTIPHKESIIPFLDDVAEDARRLGAVNTVVNADDKGMVGHNTDLDGFLRPLRERNVSLAGQHAVVLGAGGAARAVAHGLGKLDAAHVTVANRTEARARALTEALDSGPSVEACALDDPALAESLRQARLLVNATSVGMHPHDDASPLDPTEAPLHADLVVYDLVYRPLRTQLLADAASHHADPIDGLEMLIGQALHALRLWLPDTPAVSWSLRDDLRAYLRGKLLDDEAPAE